MSAAKMVADSTQGDFLEAGSTRKRKVVQKKKQKKRKDSGKKKRKNSSEDEYDSSDLDLDKVVMPLGHFVKDRGSMLSEMFHSMQGECLQRNLPDVLKELPLEDLKKRCLEQLEVMSKKRIRRIMDGDDPTTISSSGTDDESTDEENKRAGKELEKGEFDGTLQGDMEQDGTFEGDMEGTVEGDIQGDVENESELEGQVADSTSQYTQDTLQSDRDDWEESNADDDSVTGTNLSPAYSEDYQEVDKHYENEDRATETEESATESSDFIQAPKLNKDEYKQREKRPIQTHAPAKPKKKAVVRDPNEEVEEGEVFDDDDDEEEEGDEMRNKVEHDHKVEQGKDQATLMTKVRAELIQDEPAEDSNMSAKADGCVNKIHEDGVKVSDEDGKSANSLLKTNELIGTILIEEMEVREQVAESVVGTISSTETEPQSILDQKPDITAESNNCNGDTQNIAKPISGAKKIAIEIKQENDTSDYNKKTLEQTISRDVSDQAFSDNTNSSDGQDSKTAGSDTRNVKVKAIDERATSSQTTSLDQKRVVIVKDSNTANKLKAEESNRAAEDIIRLTVEDSECINIAESDDENSASKEEDNENHDGGEIDDSKSRSGLGKEPDANKVQSIAGPSESSGQTRRVVKPPSREIAPSLTRNQMELLELEMRARAIKAMLKKATLK